MDLGSHFQQPRYVPVISFGEVPCTVVLPLHIDLELAQRRVHRASHVLRQWQLVTLSPESWVIHACPLPSDVLDMLDELDTWRTNGRRGGHRLSYCMANDICIKGNWDFEDDTTTIAELVCDMAELYQVSSDGVMFVGHDKVMSLEDHVINYVGVELYVVLLPYVGREEYVWPWPEYKIWEMAQIQRGEPTDPMWMVDLEEQEESSKEMVGLSVYLAHDNMRSAVLYVSQKDSLKMLRYVIVKKYGRKPDEVLVMADDGVPKDDEILEYLCGHGLYVLFMDDLDSMHMSGVCDKERTLGMYHLQRTMMNEEERQEWETQKMSKEDHDDNYVDELFMVNMQRGGVRDGRRLPDQRAQMINWAIDKIREHLPDMPIPTATMLCRAETRTITAVLHSKSATQTRQVMDAACKRAGIPTTRQLTTTLEQRDETVNLDHVVEAIKNQTLLFGQLMEVISQVPTADTHNTMIEAFRLQQHASMQAVTALATAVGKVESRLERWEHQRIYLERERRMRAEEHQPTQPYEEEDEDMHDCESRQGEEVPEQEASMAQHEAPQEGREDAEQPQQQPQLHVQQGQSDAQQEVMLVEEASQTDEDRVLRELQGPTLLERLEETSQRRRALRPFASA